MPTHAHMITTNIYYANKNVKIGKNQGNSTTVYDYAMSYFHLI